MCDRWMRPLELPLTLEQFHALPRNPAWKYEYIEGRAWLSPRPRFHHALLDLVGFQARGEGSACEAVLRPLRADDWERLEPVFAGSFAAQPPFAGLDADTRREAARQSLRQTRNGGDGPWIEAASFVAGSDADHLVGALMTTLLPDADPTGWDSYHWREPPPADAVARRLGRPHLTWIFVAPLSAGRGIGTALLRTAAEALLALGYRHLASTFLLGNHSSMLWHWRNGFTLIAHPASRRRP